MRRFINDESGVAWTLVLLLLMPLFIFTLSAQLNITNTVTVAGVDVVEGVAVACKAAAMQVDATAQADGIIRIVGARARDEFEKALAGNLGLDANLNPVSGQYAQRPKYWLLVYNGYNDYSGCPASRLYAFNSGVRTYTDLSFGGFPYSFAVSASGITVGTGTRTVELESPGVIAVVEIEANRLTGDKKIIVQRWAAARVVCKDGTCRAY